MTEDVGSYVSGSSVSIYTILGRLPEDWENPKKIGSVYTSTKNKENHGFGLMRVDKVVEKYHGYQERQHEEGVFATEIMLPL